MNEPFVLKMIKKEPSFDDNDVEMLDKSLISKTAVVMPTAPPVMTAEEAGGQCLTDG